MLGDLPTWQAPYPGTDEIRANATISDISQAVVLLRAIVSLLGVGIDADGLAAS